MLWVALIVVFMILAILAYHYDIISEWWMIIIIVLSPILCLVVNLIVCSVDKEIIIPLYAGYNSSTIQGEFFLGSGNINGVDMVYYWVDDNGVLTKHSVPMSDSSFIEDGKNVLIQKCHNVCPSNLYWLFLSSVSDEVKLEFHIPKGSIIQMYNFQ